MILIFDSNGYRQRQLRAMLAALGHKAADILSVSDPKTALATLRETRFDYCFVATGMPGTGANSFLETVKAGGAGEFPPIIAYGSGTASQDVRAAVDAGASSVLNYPFSASDVEMALLNCRCPDT